MTETITRTTRPASKAIAFTDCDVHNALSAPQALLKYLPARWHGDYERGRGPGGTTGGGLYPSRPQNGIFRWDAKPPTGGVPGSDFEFLKEHYLDAWPVQQAILAPLDANGWSQYGAFGGAIVSAINDWMAAEWLGRDARLYGGVSVTMEDGRRAAQEIARAARHPRYWPIYEAAEAAGLPVAVHVGGLGNPMTGAGWPSYHYEYHASFVHTFHAQVVSLIASGVFAAFPKLRFVMEEGGFAWLPSLIWRMDRTWRLMGAETTHLDEPPSAVLKRHFWFTTQPMDEAERPEQFLEMLGHLDRLGMLDRVMFSTDYPHWDFDSPEKAFPDVVSGEPREKIFRRNAQALYRFQTA